MGGVTGTAFATDTQVKQAIDALYQRREVQVARFEASAYASKVQPTEADLKAYYDAQDRKSTRLNSSHLVISYAVFCLKKKTDTDFTSAEFPTRNNEELLAGWSNLVNPSFSIAAKNFAAIPPAGTLGHADTHLLHRARA